RVWICPAISSDVSPPASTSPIRGIEILPSGRTGMFTDSASFPQTVTCIWSSTPMRYSSAKADPELSSRAAGSGAFEEHAQVEASAEMTRNLKSMDLTAGSLLGWCSRGNLHLPSRMTPRIQRVSAGKAGQYARQCHGGGIYCCNFSKYIPRLKWVVA